MQASSATIKPLLAASVGEYADDLREQFMGLDVLPSMEVDSKNGSYGIVPVENVTDATGDGKRAPGGGYQRNDSDVETQDWACLEYGLEEPLDDSESRDIANILDAEREVTTLQAFRLIRLDEKRVASAVFNTTTFSSYTGGVSVEWDNASGTPYSDIQDTILTLKNNVGGALAPGMEICLAVSEKVYRNMVKTTEIQGKIKGGDGSTIDKDPSTSRDIIAKDRLARILGVDRVFCSNAQDGGSDIWDDEYAMLFIRGTGGIVTRMQPQMGRTIMWTTDAMNPFSVESYREENRRSNIYRVRHQTDEQIMVPAAGYLLSNITTT
jgi:hypothetical protein